MSKYKLSICLPAHRVLLWEQFYNSVQASITDAYSWEMILVGPHEPSPFFEDKNNFKFFKDYGTPSRCAQIAVMLAEGELIMWGSDDGIFTPNSIKECIELHDRISEKDVVALRYTESRNYAAIPMHPDYWMAHHHPTLRVVPEHYKIILVGMFKTSYFNKIGGWDCRFEHLNMNCHDLAFRVQRDGGIIHLSPNVVSNHDWNPNEGDHKPVQEAYDKNDLGLFNELHSVDQSNRIYIDYNNWKDSPLVWERRFGKK